MQLATAKPAGGYTGSGAVAASRARMECLTPLLPAGTSMRSVHETFLCLLSA